MLTHDVIDVFDGDVARMAIKQRDADYNAWK